MIVAYNSIYCEVVTFGKDAEAPVLCFPIWPYQSLPDFLPVLHNPLVVLVWSAHRLPMLTNLPIWVGSGRASPLPIITTATKQLTIDQKHQVGRTVKGVGFAGLAVW